MSSFTSHGRPWGPGDLTGGPLDEVLARVRAALPWLVVERLEVRWPGDDGNVYFLGDERDTSHVQIDTRDDGQPPFLIEGPGRLRTSDVAEAAAVVSSWLRSARAGAGDGS
jgi:hypothetical protein